MMEISSQHNIEDIPHKIACDESDKSQIKKYPNFIRNFEITGGYLSILIGIISLLLPNFNYPAPCIAGWPTDVIPFYKFFGILSLIIGITILKPYSFKHCG
ncbi:MAG: hypothetical protein GPJ54_07600 [Candidatus Heimdallarchaeota archaeon]|nr:hypothetical protein [Candidatus Heimdallarchaeota archaeon]